MIFYVPYLITHYFWFNYTFNKFVYENDIAKTNKVGYFNTTAKPN